MQTDILTDTLDALKATFPAVAVVAPYDATKMSAKRREIWSKYDYKINGDKFRIEDTGYGWVWVRLVDAVFMETETNDEIYPTYNDAPQGALDYMAQRAADEETAREEEIDIRLYGDSLDQERAEYHAMTGGNL